MKNEGKNIFSSIHVCINYDYNLVINGFKSEIVLSIKFIWCLKQNVLKVKCFFSLKFFWVDSDTQTNPLITSANEYLILGGQLVDHNYIQMKCNCFNVSVAIVF